MATIVNLRRIERLEEKTGGTNWVQRLSDQQLDAIILAIGSGEHNDAMDIGQKEREESVKYLEPVAGRCSNYPDFLDKVLDEFASAWRANSRCYARRGCEGKAAIGSLPLA